MQTEPSPDCPLCPRLVEFRSANRIAYPEFFNRPVPSFGDRAARLMVVGLAPGLKGANRTGRPFTGDFAGDLLYETLLAYGFARGTYRADPADGLELVDCIIVNAVRCVPPENKPTGAEAATCRQFLTGSIAGQRSLRAIVALGRIAHDSVLAAIAARRSAYAFGHGREHSLENGLQLIDSYHCSRYNTNTGKLTPEMFRSVFARAREVVSTEAATIAAS